MLTIPTLPPGRRTLGTSQSTLEISGGSNSSSVKLMKAASKDAARRDRCRASPVMSASFRYAATLGLVPASMSVDASTPTIRSPRPTDLAIATSAWSVPKSTSSPRSPGRNCNAASPLSRHARLLLSARRSYALLIQSRMCGSSCSTAPVEARGEHFTERSPRAARNWPPLPASSTTPSQDTRAGGGTSRGRRGPWPPRRSSGRPDPNPTR